MMMMKNVMAIKKIEKDWVLTSFFLVSLLSPSLLGEEVRIERD